MIRRSSWCEVHAEAVTAHKMVASVAQWGGVYETKLHTTRGVTAVAVVMVCDARFTREKRSRTVTSLTSHDHIAFELQRAKTELHDAVRALDAGVVLGDLDEHEAQTTYARRILPTCGATDGVWKRKKWSNELVQRLFALRTSVDAGSCISGHYRAGRAWRAGNPPDVWRELNRARLEFHCDLACIDSTSDEHAFRTAIALISSVRLMVIIRKILNIANDVHEKTATLALNILDRTDGGHLDATDVQKCKETIVATQSKDGGPTTSHEAAKFANAHIVTTVDALQKMETAPPNATPPVSREDAHAERAVVWNTSDIHPVSVASSKKAPVIATPKKYRVVSPASSTFVTAESLSDISQTHPAKVHLEAGRTSHMPTFTPVRQKVLKRRVMTLSPNPGLYLFAPLATPPVPGHSAIASYPVYAPITPDLDSVEDTTFLSATKPKTNTYRGTQDKDVPRKTTHHSGLSSVAHVARQFLVEAFQKRPSTTQRPKMRIIHSLGVDNNGFVIVNKRLTHTLADYTTETAVQVPVKVEVIGASAFRGWKSVEKVTLPLVTTVDTSAFKNCTSLQVIEASKVITIGEFAFSGCAS